MWLPCRLTLADKPFNRFPHLMQWPFLQVLLNRQAQMDVHAELSLGSVWEPQGCLPSRRKHQPSTAASGQASTPANSVCSGLHFPCPLSLKATRALFSSCQIRTTLPEKARSLKRPPILRKAIKTKAQAARVPSKRHRQPFHPELLPRQEPAS